MQDTLIVDAGSTKTQWSLLGEDTGEVFRLQTPGINPAIQSDELIEMTVTNALELFPEKDIKEIHYFGAGCVSDIQKDRIKKILTHFHPSSLINVESDLMAAVTALWGKGSGIVAILGTGSNSCLVIDGKIESKIPSLGYVLGDEGSGAALGKRLLNGIFKRQLPLSITEQFFAEYSITLEELIEKTYRGESPSRFLASFSPFASKNLNQPEIEQLAKEEFRRFFKKNILPYQSHLPLGLIGSIAVHFKDLIMKVAKEYDITDIKVLGQPMPELEKYYSLK